ncbi:MAG: helix-turn-helix transcriptional regulator, partial [Clostridia bacterium]|nr:helix-turn-helix transcriptional regulator [Clostridia bacterium]
ACAYIDAHHTDNLRQADVAAAVGVSPWYFSRLFRQYVLISFPEYLCRVRVHTARHLLTSSSLTITECAYQAGFQSTTVFNKAFLALTGTSPREYRRGYVGQSPENSEA